MMEIGVQDFCKSAKSTSLSHTGTICDEAEAMGIINRKFMSSVHRIITNEDQVVQVVVSEDS